TTTLSVNFNLPRNWTGLVISFLFGVLVLVQSLPWIQRVALYVLNSLVIFAVALGANTTAVAATHAAALPNFTEQHVITHWVQPCLYELPGPASSSASTTVVSVLLTAIR